MTLTTIASTLGKTAGFKFKSLKTGKVWEAVTRTPSGKFLIVTEGKETLVSGTEDRYEMVADKMTELMTKLETIEKRRETIVDEIDALDSEEMSVQAEINALS